MSVLSAQLMVTVFDIPDYKGGDNPLLVYAFAAIILFLVGSTIAAIIKANWRTISFYRYLSSSDLSTTEQGIVRNYLKRFRVKDPLLVVTDEHAFESFMQKVARHYETIKMKEEDLLREGHLFDSVRQKLRLHQMNQTESLQTSRALAIDHSLQVTYSDRTTGEEITFESKVITNSSLFLGISPPSVDLAKQVVNQERPRLTVSFLYGDNIQHRFESRYLRTMNQGEEAWVIRHSADLAREQKQARLEIPSMITITSSEDPGSIQEIEGTLTDLSNTHGMFEAQAESPVMPTGSGLLVTFDLDDESYSLRASIEDVQVLERGPNYRLVLNNLDQSEQKKLIRFASKLRSSKK